MLIVAAAAASFAAAAAIVVDVAVASFAAAYSLLLLLVIGLLLPIFVLRLSLPQVSLSLTPSCNSNSHGCCCFPHCQQQLLMVKTTTADPSFLFLITAGGTFATSLQSPLLPQS